jgi:hypothetical protein
VPHISLVFREMWDTTAVNHKSFGSQSALRVKTRGLPHLAKNERDVGHPMLSGQDIVLAACLCQTGVFLVNAVVPHYQNPIRFGPADRFIVANALLQP